MRPMTVGRFDAGLAGIRSLSVAGYEDVVACQDPVTGLRALVAIHDTSLGPAVGGTRMLPYESEEQALADVLRLSRAMTYKAAAAELDFGGGKAVIIGDPERDKNEELLLAFGRLLEGFQGRFVTGEDVGTTADDMRVVARETKHAIFPPKELDPEWETAFLTAHGVLRGIQACVNEAFGNTSLDGVKIALQGLGKVGERLARMLKAEGARLIVTDLNSARLSAVADAQGASVAEPGRILEADAEVFCPCALGGVLNPDSIARLRCRIVAGAANNQLAEERGGEQLWKRSILYAPDYVINAGGLISALYEMGLSDRAGVIARTDRVFERLMEIFDRSKVLKIPSNIAADRLVEERIQRAREKRGGQTR